MFLGLVCANLMFSIPRISLPSGSPHTFDIQSRFLVHCTCKTRQGPGIFSIRSSLIPSFFPKCITQLAAQPSFSSSRQLKAQASPVASSSQASVNQARETQEFFSKSVPAFSKFSLHPAIVEALERASFTKPSHAQVSFKSYIWRLTVC